jgi:hypothetical protein
MMNAREAFEAVENAYLELNNKTLSTELAQVEEALNKLIKGGSGSKKIIVYKMSPITQKHLKSLGYDVKYNSSGSFRGEDSFEITF